MCSIVQECETRPPSASSEAAETGAIQQIRGTDEEKDGRTDTQEVTGQVTYSKEGK